MIITVTTFEGFGYDDWTPTAFLSLIEQAVKAIPTEYLDKARVELDGGYEESTRLAISYKRPETDEEMAARRESARQYREDQKERERHEYERLKRKFNR